MPFSALPKVELHLHLDCSLSFDVVQQLDPQIINEEKFREQFIAPDKCRDLADYISRSESAVVLMQDREALQLVTDDLFKQLQADNVIYAEIRFAPLLHTRKDLSAEEVVEAVNAAVEEQVNETGIEAGIILCTLRHYSEDQSMETVKLVEQFSDSRVVGFDIAADEAGFPIDNHISAFEYANEKGFNCTAHAGEACGAESVWETLINFKPSRIGHGVRSAEDDELLDYLKDHEIHLEVCPTSNVQTNVFDTISDHSINSLYEEGISLSVNTDTRTISNVTLEEEYQMLSDLFDWDVDQLLRCNIEAINHAFTDEQTKEKLRGIIREAYANN
ncbi:adenosine deaminase [Fodinibius sp.]|uniref:adenosine deaminase n=1 Tax=Fodinibius sp. TaxID=1872440 RepID=UPI002ACD78D6|nr:adenosine deaminase [Fodinibius sp.]MDZ7659318.1 adenosine deaminase [Fodinibius sp.]